MYGSRAFPAFHWRYIFQVFYFRWGRPLCGVAILGYAWLVNLQFRFIEVLSGLIRFFYSNRCNCYACAFLYIIAVWPCIVPGIISPVFTHIIYYCGIFNNGNVARPVDIIPVHIPVAKIPAAHKRPLVVRYIIAVAVCNVYPNARPDWRPSVIVCRLPPGNPSGAPFITGYPHGPVIRVGIPAAIMKRRPAPCIIGNPRPSFICKNPVPVGVIRAKAVGYIGHPYITISGCVNPCAIGAKVVVKNLIV